MCDSLSVILNVSLCCVQGGLYAAGHERATHRLGEMKALEDLLTGDKFAQRVPASAAHFSSSP